MQRTLTSRPNLAKVAQMTDLDKGAQSEGDMEALIDSLEQRVSLRSQGTNLFQLEFSDNSPRVARDVVQALLTIFVESSVGNKRVDIQTARSFIEEQLEEYEKDYLQRMEQERIEQEQAYQKAVESETQRKSSQTRGTLPKGFEPKPAPEAPKPSRGTLPKGF